MKQDYFSANNIKYIDYKDVEILKKFLNPSGKIVSHKRSGVTSKNQRALAYAGLSLALAATAAWVFAADGRLSASAIIGWWFGWSVYEVLIRMQGKRVVKDGPWWRARYREANWMDMLSYVGFKNLLIGASLFLLLKSLGALA